MDHIDRITQAECRAERIGTSLRAVCEARRVRSQYLYRWKSGAVEPTVRMLNKTMREVEAEIDARERELFCYLAGRLLPEGDADELCALIESAAELGLAGSPPQQSGELSRQPPDKLRRNKKKPIRQTAQVIS